jgi:hypothetical protein
MQMQSSADLASQRSEAAGAAAITATKKNIFCDLSKTASEAGSFSDRLG